MISILINMQSTFEILIKQITPFSLGFVFLITYLAENIIPEKNQKKSTHHDLINIGVGIINLLITFGVGFYFQKFIGYTASIKFGLLHQIEIPSYIKIILGFIFIDFFMYWWHRYNHEINFLWAFHQFHHKDEQMNSTTAIRFHWVELLLSYCARFMIYPILGISVSAILVHGLILFPIIVLHHSNISISAKKDSIIRLIFVSPLMHRIHHSPKKTETNSNYSSFFSFWDLIFKTNIKKSDSTKFGI
jgi:sterol desaturase/sphingolipid hydroxylase (fatty acid hydroxylase superfamily)